MNQKHGSEIPTAFLPNILRRYPLIAFGKENERLCSPLPQLLLLRITAGVYYDLVGGPAHLRNEAAGRFEQYGSEFIAATLPKFEVNRSRSYQLHGKEFATPDILVKNDGKIILVVECKSTKLTFAAQFAEDPIAEAKRGYDELAKGVFQLWRYFSHARRAIIDAESFDPQAYGIVLTLDSWLMISKDMEDQVVAAARGLADGEGDIAAEDRRKIVFCSMPDLENILSIADEVSLLRTLTAAQDPKFVGWTLPNIHRELDGTEKKQKGFPFELGDVMPWWKEIDEVEAAQRG